MQQRMVNAAEVAKALKPGQRIFVSGGPGEPATLLAALREQPLPADLTFIQFPLPGYNANDFTAWYDSFRFVTFFMTPALRGAAPERLDYLPMQMRAVYDYVGAGVDVALIQAARDRDGVIRIAPNVDFVEAVLAGAGLVVAELNDAFVAPAGAPELPAAVWVMPAARPLYESEPPAPDPVSQAIGKLVAGLIRDGDCLQTGIGAIPAAILAALDDRNDLGMHGGLIDDGGMRLIARGNLTGSNKPIDTGYHIAGMALGSAGLLQALAECPEVQFRSANYTHEVAVIRQLPQFVSVNSAVEIDLYGQVNAEFAGGRQISGTGGSVDFMRAAKASSGGRSIVAMPATARGGSRSRIVPRVELVTALRTDVDMVVTEYGVAALKNLPVRARAGALIDIAAPDFREELKTALQQGF